MVVNSARTTHGKSGLSAWRVILNVGIVTIVQRLGRNVSTLYGCWEQWSMDGTASKKPGSRQPVILLRGKTTVFGVRLLRHHIVPAAEIRAAVSTTVTQRTVRHQLLQGQLRARNSVACIPLTASHCHL
ncbi:uncharacterized protein TNCV_4952511 [Trichonephila clavipes]|nr:uncharacterized protein TNCV_4952511 [Trichonephila clavipes]